MNTESMAQTPLAHVLVDNGKIDRVKDRIAGPANKSSNDKNPIGIRDCNQQRRDHHTGQSETQYRARAQMVYDKA